MLYIEWTRRKNCALRLSVIMNRMVFFSFWIGSSNACACAISTHIFIPKYGKNVDSMWIWIHFFFLVSFFFYFLYFYLFIYFYFFLFFALFFLNNLLMPCVKLVTIYILRLYEFCATVFLFFLFVILFKLIASHQRYTLTEQSLRQIFFFFWIEIIYFSVFIIWNSFLYDFFFNW